MDESVSPLESGLAWTVDLKMPRDFIGRTALLAKPAS
jgi:aminomethyltransferase